MKLYETIRNAAMAAALVAFGNAAANGPVHVTDAWATATPPTAVTGAAYFVAQQRGDGNARLIGAASPVAKRVELHTHTMKDGMMTMRKLDGVDVEPDTPLVFKPGSHHVMLMGLNEPLKAGQAFPLTLIFDDGSEVDVTVKVRAAGDMRHGGHGTGHSTMEHSKP